MKIARGFVAISIIFIPLLFGFLALTVLPAAAQELVLPGKFDVSSQGQATFSIPVEVPPGTGGMVPSLSLEYMSGGGNGPLGVGWSLGGLSAITRCPQTVAQDGQTVPVNYSASDRFCLDGQRLVAINNGVYGANGTHYRTEIESFSDIVSLSLPGNASQLYFVVTTKAGQTMEYGNTTNGYWARSHNNASNNAAVALSGIAPAASYLLDQVNDTTGNYLIIGYQSNPTNVANNSEYEPAEIDYTGNYNTGLNAYNKVTFVYAARPDIVPHYSAGALIEATQRLTDIETWSGNQSSPGSTEVNDYKFGYTTSQSTGRSLLSSIQKCDSADSNCLPARTFSYQMDGLQAGGLLPTANVKANFAGLNNQYSGYQIYPADFAGTGESGALLVHGTAGNGVADGVGVAVLINQAGTMTAVQATNAATGASLASSVAGYTPVMGDFNGDGKEDIFWGEYGLAGGLTSDYIWLGNGNGTFTVVNNPVSISGFVNKALVGDFNGDGKSDLFFYMATSTGSVGAAVAAQPPGGPGNWLYGTTMQLETSNCSAQSCSFTSAGSDNFIGPSGGYAPVVGEAPYLVDVNGDGKSDIYWEPEDGNGRVKGSTATAVVWYGPITLAGAAASMTSTVTLSSGTVTSATAALSLSAVQGRKPVWGDFNGDGLPDILWDAEDTYGRSTGALPLLWLNTGNPPSNPPNTGNIIFYAPSLSSALANTVTGYRPYAADFNGDGQSDILWDYEGVDGGTNGTRYLWISTGSGFSATAANTTTSVEIADGATNNVASQDGTYTDSTTATSAQSALYATTAYHPIIGNFTGDGKASILWDDYNINSYSQGSWMLWSDDGVQPDLLSSLTNGLGTSSTMATTSITYGTPPAGWGTHYQGAGSATCNGDPAPPNAIDFAPAMPVVTSTSSSNGISGQYASNFWYGCARLDTQGRGFLGFVQQDVQDAQTGIAQTKTFDQAFPFIGAELQENNTVYYNNATITLKQTNNTYAALTPSSSPALPWSGTGLAETAPQFPYVSKSFVGYGTDLNGAPMPWVSTWTTYDGLGEALTVCTSKTMNNGSTQGPTQITTNTYQTPPGSAPNFSPWFLGRLTQSSVASSLGGTSTCQGN